MDTNSIDTAAALRSGDRFTLRGREYIMDGSRCWSTYAPTSTEGERVTFYAFSVAKLGPSRLVTVRATSKLTVGSSSS